MFRAILTRRGTVFFRTLALLCMLHALVVVLLWLEQTFLGVLLVSGKVWVTLAWLWLLWPIALALHPAASRRDVAIPTVVGLVLLAPVPEAYFYSPAGCSRAYCARNDAC